MGGENTEEGQLIRQAVKEIQENKNQYRELLQMKKSVNQERDVYFDAIKAN